MIVTVEAVHPEDEDEDEDVVRDKLDELDELRWICQQVNYDRNPEHR